MLPTTIPASAPRPLPQLTRHSCISQQPLYRFVQPIRLPRRLRRGGGCNSVVRATATTIESLFPELLRNEPLLSASITCVAAQLLKPVFVAATERQGFNWRLAFTSGGMPSSHSAVVNALALSLLFERGASDGVFGAAVVYAAIIMYDAQGVRLAAGKQAQVLNSIVLPALSPAVGNASSAVNWDSERTAGSTAERNGGAREGLPVSIVQTEGDREGELEDNGVWADQKDVRAAVAVMEHGTNAIGQQHSGVGLKRVDRQQVGDQQPVQAVSGRVQAVSKAWSHVPLKERIGHTKLEVAVGAVSGLASSLLVHLLVFSP